jgi:UDP-N-acetylmuramyl tripeptide synthase
MRYLLVLYLVKFTNLFITLFRLGAGFTWPGHLALKLYSKSLKVALKKLPKGYILVSGTNGKTTACKMLSHILQKQGLKVVSNKSGANLLNGILSSLLLDSNFIGNSRSNIGVFEVDEFVLSAMLLEGSPRILMLLNLSRDQLDRYGEVDIIFDRWSRTIKKIPNDFHIVADISQEEFKKLNDFYKGKVVYFNESTSYLSKTKLLGKHNAKNLNACLVTASVLGYDVDKVVSSLSDFNPAYGRGEEIKYKGKNYKVFLSKNPASFNNNLDLLLENSSSCDTLFFILNDNIPDGRDVSWIYDVDAKKIKEACLGKMVFVSGIRCLEMAIRLKYAGVLIPSSNVSNNLAGVVKMLTADRNIKEVSVLPNYSAMLDLRKLIIGRKIL